MTHQVHSIIVRPFELADAEAVAGMMHELALFHDDEALATVADIARHALGDERISTILVASRDNVLCGFSATYDWMNFVHGFPVRNIDLFFVRKNVRRCGIGRTLLQAIVRDARLFGCQRVTVGAEPDNEGANVFYRQMGFDLRRSAANRYALSGTTLDHLASA